MWSKRSRHGMVRSRKPSLLETEERMATKDSDVRTHESPPPQRLYCAMRERAMISSLHGLNLELYSETNLGSQNFLFRS